MTPEQTEIITLRARVRIHRDLIAWLVACIVKQEDDPDQTLRTISRFLTEQKIDAMPEGEMRGAMQTELDAIVSDARRAL